MNKKISKKARVALSVLALVLIVLAVYFSITLIKQATAQPVAPYLIFKKGSTEVAKIGNNGDMIARSVCELQETLPPQGFALIPNGDDFLIKTSSSAPPGSGEAMITDTGYVYLTGKLSVNQASLNPSGSGNFIVKNSGGNVIAYFDSLGNLRLKGGLSQTAVVCGDNCCAYGLENANNCPADCGNPCWYECLHECGGTRGLCKVSTCSADELYLSWIDCGSGYNCCCYGTSGPC